MGVTTTENANGTAVPQVVFRAPDYQEKQHKLSTDDVLRETIDLVQRAARAGMIDPPTWHTRPGKPLLDMRTNRGAARMMLDECIASDSPSRAWYACATLQPQIGLLVTAIRRLRASDERVQVGYHLDELWSRIREAELPPD